MKFLFDLFPVILFFVTFKVYGIYAATAVAIVATFVQIGWVWLRHRKVDSMLWTSLAIIVLLGGATLIFQNESFIKWKPTVLYWLFAAVLWLSLAFFQKNLIEALLAKQIVLPATVWLKLNMSWIVFFILMGGINIHVAFNYSVDTWVNFKLFGSIGLMLIFVVIQAIILNRYMQDPENAKIAAVSGNDFPTERVVGQARVSQRKGEDV
ncbi:MAG: putative intracellular septation protein A [Nitrosomonas sp.]|jgi:intracellular septation protein|nr:MAG: putative intracellular septation protein A [Nitrosomonas sp.]